MFSTRHSFAHSVLGLHSNWRDGRRMENLCALAPRQLPRRHYYPRDSPASVKLVATGSKKLTTLMKERKAWSTARSDQRFSTSLPQKMLKHAVPDYLVRGTDLFSFTLSNKKDDSSQQTRAVWCECPVSNCKYTGHVTESCISLGMSHNTAASDWLISGTRNPYIQV